MGIRRARCWEVWLDYVKSELGAERRDGIVLSELSLSCSSQCAHASMKEDLSSSRTMNDQEKLTDGVIHRRIWRPCKRQKNWYCMNRGDGPIYPESPDKNSGKLE